MRRDYDRVEPDKGDVDDDSQDPHRPSSHVLLHDLAGRGLGVDLGGRGLDCPGSLDGEEDVEEDVNQHVGQDVPAPFVVGEEIGQAISCEDGSDGWKRVKKGDKIS